MKRKINIIVAILLMIAIGIGTTNASSTTTTYASSSDTIFPDTAPIQYNIQKMTTTNRIMSSDIKGSPKYNVQILEKNGNRIKLKATTTITFRNPKGAGYKNNKWEMFGENDNIKIKNAILSNILKTPDKNQRNNLLKQWIKYNFESGERIYVINETYNVTYNTEKSSSYITTLESDTSTSDILMGFTQEIPQIKHTWQVDVYIPLLFTNMRIASITSGINIDGAYGLRLPTSVSLNTPNPLYSDKMYALRTSIIGEDWNASKYSKANVPIEDGNEFVARYNAFLGVKMWIVGYGNVDCSLSGTCIDVNLNFGKNFKTPIGPNERFPLPSVEISPDISGLKYKKYGASIGIRLKLTPDLSTNNIIAKWKAYGDATGAGYVSYHTPNTYYMLGPVKTGNYDKNTDKAIIRLTDYRYYFNSCKATLSGRIEAGGFLPPIATNYYDIYSIDCSKITGKLQLGIHKGTSANNVTRSSVVTPSAIILPVEI